MQKSVSFFTSIEGERPRQDRIQRWGRAIGKAGKQSIDLDELLRLQRIVIGDFRFLHPGLRTEGGFVGEHDRDTRMPVPGHISVRVLNDTGDFYRFFDATPQTEFLYGCVQRTIAQDLPEEAAFLKRYDAFRAELDLMVDMPDRLSDLLFRFLHQNGGTLSRRGREREFAALTDEEVERIEGVYRDAFAD